MMGDNSPNVGETTGAVQQFSDEYARLDVDLRRYILPELAGALIMLLIITFTNIPPLITVPILLLFVLAFLGTIAYPRIRRENRRKQINERFDLFITHMTILSMTTIDRVEIFRILAQEESEYQELARECRRVVTLVDSLNMSLDKAVEVRSAEIPSELMSEFFERMSYVLGAGQEMNKFMEDENSSFSGRYEAIYKSALDNVDVVKEVYISVLLTTTFVLVFGLLLPLLMDISPMILIIGVTVFFIMVQAAILKLLDELMPYDPIWHSEVSYDLRNWQKIYKSLAISILLTIVTTSIFIPMYFGIIIDPTGGLIPGPFHVALAVMPMFYSGWVMRQEEKKVKERDESFPQFIRSLGTVEMTKQTNTSTILKDLRKKEFGELNMLIDNLYKRLKTNISERRSWELFTRESGSYLIKKFSEMYVIGRRMGSDPDVLGDIISENVNHVLSLREDRRQTASTFVGIIYGLNAAVTFSMFSALEITDLLINIADQLGNIGGALGSAFLSTANYEGVVIDPLMYVVFFVLAVSGGIMVRKLDGGHLLNSQIHIVALIWMNSLVATMVIWGADSIAIFG